MIIGEVLMYPSAGGPYYSPWFPSGGNAAIFTLDLIAVIGGGSLSITVETKNSEDADNQISATTWNSGSSYGSGSIGMNTISAGEGLGSGSQGLLELTRFKFTVSAEAGDGVHFRMLAPSWLTNGA